MRLFIPASGINATSIENITALYLRQCIRDRGHRILDGEHLYVIDDAMKPLEMKSNII